MILRPFEPRDARPVSDMIAHTLRTANRADYDGDYLEDVIRRLQPPDILARASWQHFYVAEEDGRLIGCGAIGPYWGRTDESCLFTVFVHTDHQGRGIGRKIMEALEADEYFLRASRVEIPASITGTPFYLKMGYAYKDGITEPDAEGLLRLEKRRSPAEGAPHEIS